MSIVYLSTTFPVEHLSINDEIFQFHSINQLLFTTCHSPIIVIDLPLLFANPEISAIEILYLIVTKYRYCRDDIPKIVGGVREDCIPDMIRDSIQAGIKCFIALGSWGDANETTEILTQHTTYIPKKIKEKIKKKYRSDDVKLNARQHQILYLITKRGLSNKMIGKILNISESSVKSNIGSILKKYGLRSRTQLVIHTKVP